MGRLVAALLVAAALAAAQHGSRRWARYEPEMQNPADDPPDAWVEGEFAFARLRFRSPRGGYWRARWGTDANKSERQFIQGVRRLTRIHARSVEEIVDIDSDEIYNWPWMYAVAIGDWVLSEAQIRRLRDYFDRGGFLMVDDFHNEREWADFMAGISRILPNSMMVELEDRDAINKVVFDLKERFHIPGLQIVRGQQWERGGVGEHWRAIIDEQGRVQVAACFNMDLGDAW
ncbi:MAG: DUF4159 domain-containing protein, partial [Bryobacteraceae bacterium]